MEQRTKIVCTIGPASEKLETLEKMVKSGMDAARLNFSHGTYENHLMLIKNIRIIEKKLNKLIPIIQDLQGPRVRLGILPKQGIELKNGQKIILSCQPDNKKLKKLFKIIIPVAYRNLYKDVKPKQKILIKDGEIILKILKIKKQNIYCRVIIGGRVSSHKGINAPQARLNVQTITEKDKQDIKFGIKNKVDFIALSFIRSPQDIKILKKLIGRNKIKVIAKIEKKEAIENFDEILKVSDAIMIARGDLGLEMPIKKLAILQKEIIQKCLIAAKPVIVATQMLGSMEQKIVPTRAEVLDVANAVCDHADCVMLSGESANGRFPIETVRIMNNIIKETEISPFDDYDIKKAIKKTSPDFISSNIINNLARKLKIDAIVIDTVSGDEPKMIARLRTEIPIYACGKNKRIIRQAALIWGIIPKYLDCVSRENIKRNFPNKRILFVFENKDGKKITDKIEFIQT